MPLAMTIIAALPQITTGVSHLISWLKEMRAVGKQSGEWTAEMDAAYVAALEERARLAAWQPDMKGVKP